jgi:hypothetical protein
MVMVTRVRNHPLVRSTALNPSAALLLAANAFEGAAGLLGFDETS